MNPTNPAVDELARACWAEIAERNSRRYTFAFPKVQPEAAPVEPEPEPEPAAPNERVKSARPTTWDDVIGNTRAVAQIREAQAAAKLDGRPMPHTLLFGPPGMGKTTMSKLIAQDSGGQFFETTASTLETPADVIRYLWAMNEARRTSGNPATLFIDEIHMLGVARGRLAVDQEALFPLFEDWVFPHNLIRKTVQNMQGRPVLLTSNELRVWPFTAVGATTEPGALSQALLRRFVVQVELEPYSEAEIAQIAAGSARRLGWPVQDEALVTLAAYSRRNPGTSNNLLSAARSRARMTGRATIDRDTMAEVIERQQLFPQGLTATDIRVLMAL